MRFSRLVDKCLEDYYTLIADNNGVKERNVLSLLSRLGAPNSAFGTTLLPDLDSFGSLRGKHAHSSSKAVRSVLDPEIEYKRVRDLLSELGPLDEWLTQCGRAVR